MEWKKDGSGSIWRMNKEKLIFVFCSGLLLFVLSMPGTEKERSLEAAAVGSGGMENMDRSGTGRLLDGLADGPEKGELPGLSGGAQAVSGGSGGSLYEKELEQLGVPTEVFTSITMPQVAQPFTRKDALRAMDEGKIAVFGGGTGNPFFSTDTATALRAVEVSADVMFKATMVDGVYDKDPHKYADAKKYDTLTFTKVLEDQLAVMDGTAATLCRDNKLPILVFDLADPDNIARAVQGENVGTLVYEG